MAKTRIRIRTFMSSDVEFAVEQSAREGWESAAAGFEACLAHDPHGCFIAEAEGAPVGMVTTTLFRSSGWIGNLIVVPEQRSQGVGRQLMKEALEHLSRRGIATVRLEADPDGLELYRSFGFETEYESLRFRLQAGERQSEADAQASLSSDLPAIVKFDAGRFGDERGRLLEAYFRSCVAAYWAGEPSVLEAHAFVRPARTARRIGPWVAVDAESAEVILRTILVFHSHTDLVLGVPAPNHAALALLEAHGFEATPSCVRMRRGAPAATGMVENLFAIASGATG